MTPFLVAFAVAGWVAAGLTFGLWIGERGRRVDLGWIVGVMQPGGQGRTQEPEVERVPTEEEDAVMTAETETLAETILEEAAATGQEVSPEEAYREARQHVLSLHGGSG